MFSMCGMHSCGTLLTIANVQYVIPETARALVAKPADLTYSGETHTMQCKSSLIPQEELRIHSDAKLFYNSSDIVGKYLS